MKLPEFQAWRQNLTAPEQHQLAGTSGFLLANALLDLPHTSQALGAIYGLPAGLLGYGVFEDGLERPKYKGETCV